MSTTVAPCPPPFLQFFLPNGAPNAGGTVLTQVGGVNTATYEDSGGNTPLPNPIPLNSQGQPSDASGNTQQVFLTLGVAYTFTVYDVNGNQIDVANYVFGTIIQTAVYPQIAAEQTLGITPTNYLYPPGYVDRYGTNTTPGTTPMDTAINDACAVAGVAGANVPAAQLLANAYFISNPIVVPPSVKLRGAGPDSGATGAGTTLVYGISAANSWAVYLGSSAAAPSALQYFASIEDVGVAFPASLAVAAGGVNFNAAAYALMKNVWVVNLSTQNVTAVQFAGGSSGASCFGNTILGGYAQNVHIGVNFTNNGSICTSQTLLGFNLFGRSGDGSSVGYNFVHGSDGLQSCITGGLCEGFNEGVAFASAGTHGVYFVGVYFNGNTTDVVWSGNDEYCQIISTDLGGFTQSGAPGASNGTISGGAYTGCYVSNGPKNDTTSIAIDSDALALQKVTATNLSNIGIGKNALGSLTTGQQNTALGPLALNATTTQNSNTAVGYSALGGASNSGAQNTAVGVSAGNNNTTGTENTSVGYGANAGTTGSDNTAIGQGAVIGTTAGTATNSNQILLGDGGTSSLYCKVTTITTTSDARDKTDVSALAFGLDLICDLKPSVFTWSPREEHYAERVAPKLKGRTEHGFLAQDFQAVVAKHGAQVLRLVDESNPEKLGITPGNLLPVLVKAVQELAARVRTLEARALGE